ncbi:hypothetical protein TMatcc_007217 [Talaromyces marneffei ATCC 18224]
MWVVAGVDLVDDSGVVGVCDHKVDVGRTHGGAVHDVEQHTGGTVGGQRVWGGVVAVPIELSVGIAHKFSAKIVLGLLGVLEVVFAVGGGLPDVQHGALDGLAGLHVLDNSMHVGYLAVGVGVLDNAVSELAEGSLGRPEGAENDIGCGGEALFGDDFTDNVAYTMAFVADGRADLTNRVDEFNAEHPLGRGELDLTSKVVDVLDQRSQDHASTLGGLGSHGVDHAGSEVGVELACRHCVCDTGR